MPNQSLIELHNKILVLLNVLTIVIDNESTNDLQKFVMIMKIFHDMLDSISNKACSLVTFFCVCAPSKSVM